MLQNLDDQIRDCVHHAAQCAECARKTRSAREREHWLALEKRYLSMAQSIEFTRRLNRFARQGKRRLDGLSSPSLPAGGCF